MVNAINTYLNIYVSSGGIYLFIIAALILLKG
jgi:hypothetical protein